MQDSQPKTVLIIDDNEITTEVLKEALGGDYHIESANDGATGLEAAKALLPDLIILDVLMPGLSGYEVCRRLKKDEATKSIPVVFVTVKGDVADEIMGFEAGAVDYITKPISPPIVRARVATHLTLNDALTALDRQNQALREATRLREDVNRITRHDLKGPLQVIMLQTDLMMMRPGDGGKDLQAVEAMRNAALRMLNIINYSLDVFKMEQGNYEYEPGEVDLVEVASRAWGENRSLAQANGLTLRMLHHGRELADGQSITVHGEDLLCYSIFTHLIRNAIEASPRGETVTIDFSGDEDAVVTIHNQGVVHRDIRDCIFEKYVTYGKKHGTGLGTYSAKLMAEVQGGSITCQSSEDSGTTLTVRLPR